VAHGFPKRMRLRKRRQFLAVQGDPDSRKFHGQYFLVMAGPRSASTLATGNSDGTKADQGGRVGITVSKKVGNAVARNRIKRWVREFVRHHPAWLPETRDVVVVAKRRAAELSGYDEVREELENLGRRLSRC